MKEGEPQDTRKQSDPPAGDELQPTKHVTVKPPPATAYAEAPTPNVISYRLIMVVKVAVVLGAVGLVGAGVSSIWLRPVDGFDGWYTRLSAGVTLGSAVGGVVGALRLLAAGWNPLTWRLRK